MMTKEEAQQALASVQEQLGQQGMTFNDRLLRKKTELMALIQSYEIEEINQ